MFRQIFSLIRCFCYPLVCCAGGRRFLAHDAFYPHHREDFENMTRRRELRGTVLLSTAVFLSILGTVVYVALRKSKDTDNTDESDTKTVQERLAGCCESEQQDAAKRCPQCRRKRCGGCREQQLTTYAEASGCDVAISVLIRDESCRIRAVPNSM